MKLSIPVHGKDYIGCGKTIKEAVWRLIGVLERAETKSPFAVRGYDSCFRSAVNYLYDHYKKEVDEAVEEAQYGAI